MDIEKIKNLQTNEGLNNYEMILYYLHNDMKAEAEELIVNLENETEYLEEILPVFNEYPQVVRKSVENYKKLRLSKESQYRLFAQEEISQEIKEQLDQKEKLNLIKELLQLEEITAQIKGIDVYYSDVILGEIVRELGFQVTDFSSRLRSFFDLDLEETIYLNESKMHWDLKDKQPSKIKEWADRAKAAIYSLGANLYTNPKVRKMAVASVVLGVAFVPADALADMVDAANTIESLGETLANDIGAIETMESCNIEANIIQSTKTNLQAEFQFGNYIIDVKAFGYDAGVSKSLDYQSGIRQVKNMTDCGLEMDDVKKVSKIIRKIVEQKL